MTATHPDPTGQDGNRDEAPAEVPVRAPSHRSRLRRLYMTLRTEHRTPGKVGLGVGIGVFVGCSPLWGIHFPVAVLVATLFRLNRMLVYAAAYVANPLTIGPMIFAEVQIGHRLLHGSWLPVTLSEIETVGILGILSALIVGSIVLGAALGGGFGVLAWLIAHAGGHDEAYREIVDTIVVRFAEVSIRDAEAARSRLLRDPIYPFLMHEGVLGSGARVLDLGCGRGLIGVLVGLFTLASEPRWYLGVDESGRYVRAARQALEEVPGCVVQALDLRDFDPPPADVVVINDVLRFLPFAGQDALLRRLARALPPGARVFVREKDAGGGIRFALSALADAVKMVVPGHPRHGRHYRRGVDLRNALLAAGFTVSDRAVARAASPAWVLFEAVRRPAAVGRV
jgi:uncharacterized protein (DUF2062 family)/2-polyprenyl-3-methyl-5-hydroxy-6-metoxy-1,4-benzoquinol methylase